jgi:hypothetical protein
LSKLCKAKLVLRALGVRLLLGCTGGAQ